MMAVVVYTLYREPPYQMLLKAMVQLLSIFPGMLFSGIFVEWLYTSHFIDSCAQQTNREVLSRNNNHVRDVTICPNLEYSCFHLTYATF